MNTGIGIHEDALGGEALGAVAGDGISVVEVAMLLGIELDLAVVIEPCCDSTIGRKRLDCGEVTIGDSKGLVGRGELYVVA